MRRHGPPDRRSVEWQQLERVPRFFDLFDLSSSDFLIVVSYLLCSSEQPIVLSRFWKSVAAFGAKYSPDDIAERCVRPVGRC
jgi:hypothetical protein